MGLAWISHCSHIFSVHNTLYYRRSNSATEYLQTCVSFIIQYVCSHDFFKNLTIKRSKLAFEKKPAESLCGTVSLFEANFPSFGSLLKVSRRLFKF